jgi:hypothetical protein
MTKKIVFGVALTLVVVGLMAPSASAVCGNSKSVSTYNGLTGGYAYWKTTLFGPGTTLVGKMWQPGVTPVEVTGTCNQRDGSTPDGNRGILYFGITPGDIGLSVNLADACVQPQAACANGQLAVMAQVSKGGVTEFLTTQAPETPGGNITYDFSTFGDHPLVAIPRPRITGSSKAGTVVTANITVDPTAAGAYEGSASLILGYNILSKLAGSDPGRLASAYDPTPVLLTAPNGGSGSASVPVDCAGGSASLSRRFVVTQIVTQSGPAQTVSAPVQVSCDSSLADPKYKMVPKPKVVPNSKAKR